jgi:hypothetical protein
MKQLPSLVILLSCLATSRPAGAEGVGILDLRFEGLAPAAVDPVRARVRGSLTGLGYTVVDQDTTKRLLKEVPPGCTVGPCLARVGRILKVELVLIGTVASAGSSYELALSLLETGGGTVVAQVNQRCDVCNFAEVESAAARVTEKLHLQKKQVVALRSTLNITAVPAGAEVALDGLPQGPPPVRALLPPGKHSVEATASDLPPLYKQLELGAGETRHLMLNLVERREEIVVTPAKALRKRYPGWVKWPVLGVGLALVAPGAVLWAVDGYAGADERNLLNTRPAGIAMVGVGSAALVAGTVLWILERR